MAALPWSLPACGGGAGGGASGGGVDLPASSGLRPAQLAVLVAEGDATSEAIATAYQRARGIPEANLIRLPVSTDADAISPADFATLKTALDARLPAGVQATLVTWTRPSRVQGSCRMGITSALAFGYAERWCGGCAATAASAYFNTTTNRPFDDLGVRPSMMLGAATLADAQALIDRGIAADGSLAGGASGQAHAWLLRTSDVNRSVRHPDLLQLASRTIPGLTMHYVDSRDGSRDVLTGQADVMFHFTGQEVVGGLGSNTYRPGAVADNLTSTGGALPGGGGQTTVTQWLQAGATGSYGTVEEPCNHLQKFPVASLLVRHYAAGDTLIEAYWRSVQWPGQGLFVGEPLARPWAR